MLLSIALYCGVLLLFVAALFLLRRRWRPRAARCALAGVLLIVVALAWPVREERAAGPATHLDQVMPVWQFREGHAIHVGAPPERVFASIRPVKAEEIFLLRTLLAIRRFGRPLPPGVLSAAKGASFLDLMTRTSFRYRAFDPPREMVLETVIVRPRVVIAAMNFLVAPDGAGGSLLSTETRVAADSALSARQFAVYWRLIRPGSDIIRRMWLRAIRKRAERGGQP